MREKQPELVSLTFALLPRDNDVKHQSILSLSNLTQSTNPRASKNNTPVSQSNQPTRIKKRLRPFKAGHHHHIMSPSSSSSESSPPMFMLLLVNGFSPSELSASLGQLKSETKNIGTHNQRELYYTAYQDIQKDITKYSSVDVDNGKLYGIVKYYRSMDDSGNDQQDSAGTSKRTEYEPFTKRQRALVATPRLLMGRHIKLLVDDDDNVGSGKEFFMPWFGYDEAEAAYNDITNGEECISIDSDRGLFISTRIKRKNCAGQVSNLKSIDSLLEYVRNLDPDKPLQSISWEGHNPPKVNSYNVILTGVWPTTITHHLPDFIAHTNTTSMHEIYDLFECRRNNHYIQEAEALISKMLADVAKSHGADNASNVFVSSMKDLACAKRNALLKKVYIDSSKKKFIQNAKHDNGFETIVVKCRQGSDAGTFEEYGGVVFETFYKLDLSIYG